MRPVLKRRNVSGRNVPGVNLPGAAKPFRPAHRKISPSTRSIEMMVEQGWIAENVEQWLPRTKIRRDLFGFADLVAIKPEHKPLLIQVTTTDNMAARRRKILAEPRAIIALLGGFDIVLHGWIKPSKTIFEFRARVQYLSMEDFTNQKE